MNTNGKSPPRDYRQQVTNDAISLIEPGTARWQQPWKADLSMPMNPTTGNPTRLFWMCNVILR